MTKFVSMRREISKPSASTGSKEPRFGDFASDRSDSRLVTSASLAIDARSKLCILSSFTVEVACGA